MKGASLFWTKYLCKIYFLDIFTQRRFFMKALLKKFFLIPFLGLLLLGANAWGQNPHTETVSSQPQKFYANPDQIEVTDNGILFYPEESENPFLGNSLSYDDNGLYVELKQDYCPYGHKPRCCVCRGCQNQKCVARCRCTD
ncbi:MAG: hypothetical protein KDK71_03155 [Chlamydiia bacterium]|nr:hypothetical protein [Chlamydiia bacterium]